MPSARDDSRDARSESNSAEGIVTSAAATGWAPGAMAALMRRSADTSDTARANSDCPSPPPPPLKASSLPFGAPHHSAAAARRVHRVKPSAFSC